MNNVIGLKPSKVADKKRSLNSDFHIFNDDINIVEPNQSTATFK